MRAPRVVSTAVLAATAAWALVGVAAAQAPRREQLPSGLTLLVRENTATPVVAASLFVRVGSRWETEDDAGISHLLQQVLLKGTPTRSALEIAETAEGLGGGISASADMDFSELRATLRVSPQSLSRCLRELERLESIGRQRLFHYVKFMPSRANPSGTLDRNVIEAGIAAAVAAEQNNA